MAKILTLINETQVKRRFVKLNRGIEEFIREELKDFNKAGIWDRMEKSLLEVMDDQFDAEGLTRHWKRLSPNYADWKKQHYPSKGILELTGRLRKAATGKSNEYYSRKTAREFSYGVKNIPYALIHAKGGTIGKRFVKPRTADALHWRERGVDRFSKGHWIPTTKMPKRDYTVIPRERMRKIRLGMGSFLRRRLVMKMAHGIRKKEGVGMAAALRGAWGRI